MKPNNPYESPETKSLHTRVRGPNYFVIVFLTMIPAGSLAANLFLKPYYEEFGIDLPQITKFLFSWNTPICLAATATALIVAMCQMKPGVLRFSVTAFAVVLGLLVILVCALGYLMPAISIWKGLGWL